jgi:predicted TIM-barrel fold metal-dependent hydrolase
VIIDFHTHPVFAGTTMHPGLDRLSQAYYGREALKITVPDFIRELDRAGVDRAVLLTVCWKNQPARPRNESTAELVRQNPNRLLGFASFDPNAGKAAVEEIEYAIRELKLVGVKTIAQNAELPYNDPLYYPAYEKIQALDVPIIFHTGPSFLQTRTKFWDPHSLDDVALDFPAMKIVLAHMGMQGFMEAHSLLVRHTNVCADLSFWPLHPAYSQLIPWSLLEGTVPEKILLGSDFPVGQSPSEAVQAVKELPISEAFKAKILGENAARLLALQLRVEFRFKP